MARRKADMHLEKEISYEDVLKYLLQMVEGEILGVNANTVANRVSEGDQKLERRVRAYLERGVKEGYIEKMDVGITEPGYSPTGERFMNYFPSKVYWIKQDKVEDVRARIDKKNRPIRAKNSSGHFERIASELEQGLGGTDILSPEESGETRDAHDLYEPSDGY